MHNEYIPGNSIEPSSQNTFGLSLLKPQGI